jgi:hypothetical protein
MKWPLLAGVTAFCLAACGSVGLATVPQKIALSGSPNGVAVRASDGTVYLTDDTTNAIIASPDLSHFAAYASIPAVEGQRNSLSQIAVTADGQLFVERFGFGTASAIFNVDTTGRATLASNTNPARRRLGCLR